MLGIRHRVAHRDVGKTREVADLARRGGFSWAPLQRLNRQQGRDFLALPDPGLADADHLLARPDRPARDPADREPPDVVVVIEIAHHELERPFRIAEWRG